MANVLHKDLTGTDLHEVKGAASAPANTVPKSNGAGSAPFSFIQWTDVQGKPAVPSYFLNGTQVTSGMLIKTYTTNAVAGIFSVNLTGFTAIHNVFVSCISGGTALGTAAVAQVSAASTAAVTGSVLVFSGSQTNLGTTQAVSVTVIGV